MPIGRALGNPAKERMVELTPSAQTLYFRILSTPRRKLPPRCGLGFALSGDLKSLNVTIYQSQYNFHFQHSSNRFELSLRYSINDAQRDQGFRDCTWLRRTIPRFGPQSRTRFLHHVPVENPRCVKPEISADWSKK